MVKTQIHMHWSAINQKIKIFRDFRVFVLCPIPKNENSEILEIHQNLQNTEMWVYNFKNSLNTVQTTSISKWSSHVANHAAADWDLKAFGKRWKRWFFEKGSLGLAIWIFFPLRKLSTRNSIQNYCETF